MQSNWKTRLTDWSVKACVFVFFFLVVQLAFVPIMWTACESGQRFHTAGGSKGTINRVSFWPLHWPPYAYQVTWDAQQTVTKIGDVTFVDRGQPTDGWVYVDEAIFDKGDD